MIRHREVLAKATTGEKAEIERLITAHITEEETLERAKEQMEELRNLGRDVLSSFAEDLRNGASAGDVLVGVLDKVADKLADMATDGLLDGLTGGGKQGGGAGGGFFGAIGNMLGGMKWFANGDVFGQPTMFTYGNGKLGVMGEAGAEAVMPLTHAGGSGVGAVLNGAETTLPLMRLGSGKLGVDLRGMAPPTPFALGGTFGTVPTPPSMARSQQGAAGNTAGGTLKIELSVDVTGGTGNEEVRKMVRDGVNEGVGQALEQYDRHVLPQRVSDISAEPWGNG